MFLIPAGTNGIPSYEAKDSVVMTGLHNIVAVSVIPETIGDDTGIMDMRGKRIFEGDRITAHEEDGDRDYSIRYKADQEYPAFDCDPYIDCDSNGLSYLLRAGVGIEVIGTIFDREATPCTQE